MPINPTTAVLGRGWRPVLREIGPAWAGAARPHESVRQVELAHTRTGLSPPPKPEGMV